MKSSEQELFYLSERGGTRCLQKIRSLEKQADLIESKARGHERYANQLLSELGKLKVRDLKR